MPLPVGVRGVADKEPERRTEYRRKVERRAAKRGVTVRGTDSESYPPKRLRHGRTK